MNKWLLFFVLAVVWGSTFILIKESLAGLSALQVASLRIISAGLVLLPLCIKDFKEMKREDLLPMFLSGSFGNLIPAYLFATAQQHIPSAVAGVLNSLTPIFAFLIGWRFFNAEVTRNKVAGLFIAFTGAIMLSLAKNTGSEAYSIAIVPVLLILVATVFYGLNANFVKHKLGHRRSSYTAATALALNAIPAFIVLMFSGIFTLDLNNAPVLRSLGFVTLLGVLSSAIATIFFYQLLKKAGVVFSSMITYAIPIVAVLCGLLTGEKFTALHLLSFAVILSGVCIANAQKLKQ